MAYYDLKNRLGYLGGLALVAIAYRVDVPLWGKRTLIIGGFIIAILFAIKAIIKYTKYKKQQKNKL